MRVLVATAQGQGEVAGDFCFTVEGELVMLPVLECSSPDTCGCGRSFAGLASSRASTTARVQDLPEMTRADVRVAIADSLCRGGWLGQLDPDSDEALIDDQLDAIEYTVAAFEVGTVLGRRGTRVWDRAFPDALDDMDRIDRALRRLRNRGRG